MRQLYIILIFGFFNCKSQQTEYKVFLNELGTQKEQAYKYLAKSFEQFLKLNYPKEQSLGEQTRAYLLDVQTAVYQGVPTKYRYDSLSSVALLQDLEKSGLRKDLFIYGFEINDYPGYDIEQFLDEEDWPISDSIEVDTNFEDIIKVELTDEEILSLKKKDSIMLDNYKFKPQVNQNGLFLYALAKSMKADASFIGYVELKTYGMMSSLSNLSDGYLKNYSDKDLEVWYRQLTLIIEIFYYELLHEYAFGKKLRTSDK